MLKLCGERHSKIQIMVDLRKILYSQLISSIFATLVE